MCNFLTVCMFSDWIV